MKKTTVILIILSAVFAGSTITLIGVNKSLKSQISSQEVAIEQLSDAVSDIAKQRTLSLEINPSIENKVTSAFGSTKNVTLQYYFTIDGNSIITKPDSIYNIRLNPENSSKNNRFKKQFSDAEKAFNEVYKKQMK
jgi:hypothetical protein